MEDALLDRRADLSSGSGTGVSSCGLRGELALSELVLVPDGMRDDESYAGPRP